MPTPPTLYGLDYSVYTRIARLALEEKQVRYGFERVDIFAESGPPEHYLSVQPFGRIPALTHQDFALYETRAITDYVDQAFSGPALKPETAEQRARMTQIISVLDNYAYRPLIWPIFVERISVPRSGGVPDDKSVQAALPATEKAVEVLGGLLGDKRFFTGENVSLADLHAAPILLYFSLTPEGADLLSRHANIRRWLEVMNARPSATKTRCSFGY